MNTKSENGHRFILAPLSGRAVSLDQVPDEVFSRGLLGDGIAILPTDGRICAPADGTVSAVLETGHAYVFSAEGGLEILVHVGLDSIKLKGEGFRSYVQPGDKVKKGQLVAEVDLNFLTSRNVNTIAPVLICEGAEDIPIQKMTGDVQAGKTVVITL